MPFEPPRPPPEVKPAEPTPSGAMRVVPGNPGHAVPEQVGKPFVPGGTVEKPQPNQVIRNRP